MRLSPFGGAPVAKASVAMSPTTATGADQDLRKLLADIKSNQEQLQRSQDRIVHRLDIIELTQTGLSASQAQAAEHLQRLGSAQLKISEQVTTAAADIRLHRQDVARKYTRFPFNAGKQVTDIVELLERVLSLLPMKDVLLAQRVSKQFKVVIKGSTILQKKLYIHAEPLKWTKEGLQIYINPLLGKILYHKYIMIHVEMREVEDGETLYHDTTEPGDMDGMDKIGADKSEATLHIELADNLPGTPPDTNDTMAHPAIVKSFAREESWRWMLLTQPPIDIETIFMGKEIKAADGIRRLGDLADEFHPLERVTASLPAGLMHELAKRWEAAAGAKNEKMEQEETAEAEAKEVQASTPSLSTA